MIKRIISYIKNIFYHKNIKMSGLYPKNHYDRIVEKNMTRQYSWVIGAPIVGGIPGPKNLQDQIILSLDAYITSGTSLKFNIEKRSTIGVAGTDILSSEVTVTTSGVSINSFDSGDIDGEWLWVDISEVTGNPVYLEITLTTRIK